MCPSETAGSDRAAQGEAAARMPATDVKSTTVACPAAGGKEAGVRKSSTELHLDDMYAKAPSAKAEIDAIAESIAKETGGKVAKVPLKGRDRALLTEALAGKDRGIEAAMATLGMHIQDVVLIEPPPKN